MRCILRGLKIVEEALLLTFALSNELFTGFRFIPVEPNKNWDQLYGYFDDPLPHGLVSRKDEIFPEFLIRTLICYPTIRSRIAKLLNFEIIELKEDVFTATSVCQRQCLVQCL
jgi:hypothetical protein